MKDAPAATALKARGTADVREGVAFNRAVKPAVSKEEDMVKTSGLRGTPHKLEVQVPSLAPAAKLFNVCELYALPSSSPLRVFEGSRFFKRKRRWRTALCTNQRASCATCARHHTFAFGRGGREDLLLVCVRAHANGALVRRQPQSDHNTARKMGCAKERHRVDMRVPSNAAARARAVRRLARDRAAAGRRNKRGQIILF